jgi:hypothetical protein
VQSAKAVAWKSFKFCVHILTNSHPRAFMKKIVKRNVCMYDKYIFYTFATSERVERRRSIRSIGWSVAEYTLPILNISAGGTVRKWNHAANALTTTRARTFAHVLKARKGHQHSTPEVHKYTAMPANNPIISVLTVQSSCCAHDYSHCPNLHISKDDIITHEQTLKLPSSSSKINGRDHSLPVPTKIHTTL